MTGSELVVILNAWRLVVILNAVKDLSSGVHRDPSVAGAPSG
jgi:hypothetical protein